jgi:hypothetical protein
VGVEGGDTMNEPKYTHRVRVLSDKYKDCIGKAYPTNNGFNVLVEAESGLELYFDSADVKIVTNPIAIRLVEHPDTLVIQLSYLVCESPFDILAAFGKTCLEHSGPERLSITLADDSKVRYAMFRNHVAVGEFELPVSVMMFAVMKAMVMGKERCVTEFVTPIMEPGGQWASFEEDQQL